MNTSIHKDNVRLLMDKYGLAGDLYFVDNVAEWSTARGLPDNNSSRLAIAAKRSNSEVRDLVFKTYITDSDIPGVTSAMQYRGLKADYNKLNQMEYFFWELVLHEIAHSLGIKEEKDADEWALKELDSMDVQNIIKQK